MRTENLVGMAVTMPGLVVLGVMASYYLLRRANPANPPKRNNFAALAALLPLVVLVCLWPSNFFEYNNYRYGNSYHRYGLPVVCLYGAYYLIGFVIYFLCCQVLEEHRPKVFSFFFRALLAVVALSLFFVFPRATGILILFALIALGWCAVYGVQKLLQAIPQQAPVASDSAPETSAPEMPAETAAPQKPEAMPLQELRRVAGGAIACVAVAWFCLFAYTVSPRYFPVILFWGVISGVGVMRKPPPKEEVSPSPSSPSQGID